ncbi:MAG: transcriptional repressor [Nitrospirae bacterium]|nr:transcriptional repressor [Nitrospirota bacterium]
MAIINNRDFITARETLSAYINEKGLRETKQRQIILDAFLSSGRHITATELHKRISGAHPEIGFATVQRNLNLFCESGIAEEIKIGRQKTRYEQKIGHEHHDHLICVKCGDFIEVHDDKIENLQNKLAAANNFRPIRHKLEIYGYCGNCK